MEHPYAQQNSPSHQAPAPILRMLLPSPPVEEVGQSGRLGPTCSYPLGEVEGGDAQWPEAAEHGEDSEPQVVPGGQREEVVFTLTLC